MKKILVIFVFASLLPLFIRAELSNSSSEFMKGYIFSKLEDNLSDVTFDVVDNNIIIYSWPADVEFAEIKDYLECLGLDCNVVLGTPCPHFEPSSYELNTENLCVKEPIEEGKLLPELNPFFPTMLAQPHILGYSAGYRSHDKIFKSTLPVSIGDQFSLYQFKIDWLAGLYIGIEACVWAVFEAKPKSLSLINSDYFISLPLTYINNRFSARLRIFHESSHLGDEFLLENTIHRKNPSMEGIELSLAYEPIDRLDYFLGYRRIIRSDDGFKVKPNSVYYGFNYFFDFAKVYIFNVEGFPYLATFFENNENNNWSFDSSIALGYQWDKSYGRKVRIFLIGHDGFSAEGQFARKKSKYISVNLEYGY